MIGAASATMMVAIRLKGRVMMGSVVTPLTARIPPVVSVAAAVLGRAAPAFLILATRIAIVSVDGLATSIVYASEVLHRRTAAAAGLPAAAQAAVTAAITAVLVVSATATVPTGALTAP